MEEVMRKGIFHIREQGKEGGWGINLTLPTHKTAWTLILSIPYQHHVRKVYYSLDSDTLMEGRRLSSINLRVRRRRKRDFDRGFKPLWLFTKNTWKNPIGYQRLVATREMVEDMGKNWPLTVHFIENDIRG